MTAPLAQAPATAPARKRALVVDDDPILREVMCEQLEAVGFDVVQAENGETGRDLTGREDFNLAIVDISMPKLNGFDLLRHIRQHPRSVDLPVIVATGFNDRGSVEKAYELGASSFVTKPVNWPQFAHHALFVMRNGEIERALRQAQMEAVTASKMKNGLFHVLSHELKTPLTALIGLTGVLSEALQGRVEPAQDEQLHHVVDAAQRLNAIISDILILSKALSGPSRQQIVANPVRDLVDDSLVGLKAKARERDITIVTRQPDETLRAVGDPRLLRQALHKLIDNAIKFSPMGGTVEIRVHGKEDGSVVISVRDQGPGLSAAKLRDCLQPFVQDDMSYGRPVEGLGLGLPIAKSIAEAHGGELLFQTAPGQGMLAAIWLPFRHLDGQAALRA
ncbi:MAG: hybrid sensor histidine kinase/response regulator [Rhizobiales bacterium]|nr:hybrid sensor histidine kinase/response regulator [Hyphomicrobiales bacterium]